MNTCHSRKMNRMLQAVKWLWNLYLKMAIGNVTRSRNVITYRDLNKGLGWLSNKEKVTICIAFF